MGGNQAAAGGPDQFAGAYKSLRADPSVQFNLTPPNPQPQSPQWLRDFFEWLGNLFAPVGRFLAWLASFLPEAPYARILMWTVIAVAAALLLWALYNRLRHGEWRIRRPRLAAVGDIELEDDWAPDDAPARSWLEEAEALAREGRYAEAIHHLLFRSIEDIARRRPSAVRPALTSRELAASTAVPERARSLFAGIARLVERSLFGGRPVGEPDWVKARESYAEFALAGAWR
ncbi:MAG: DUF4129 domain-containing protein [Sphingomicrobium sp.]